MRLLVEYTPLKPWAQVRKQHSDSYVAFVCVGSMKAFTPNGMLSGRTTQLISSSFIHVFFINRQFYFC